MIKREHYLLCPATILFLAPSWLIEQRYTLIPFSFFLLFRRQGQRSDEYFTAGLFVFLSLVLLLGITGQKFFL
jgi:alpha-1,2-glucosyltransferase